MKVITANFVTCAVKECKTSAASFPLHFHDAELEQQELDFQPEFIRNVLPRIDWESLRVTANEVREFHQHTYMPEANALQNGYWVSLSKVLPANNTIIARISYSPRDETGRRCAERGTDIEGSTPAIAGDAGYRGEIGLWELRTSVCY